MHQVLEGFRTLPPDWNGSSHHDIAPIPSEWALGRAQQILDLLAARGNHPADEDINADAIGGVAIYLYAKDPSKNVHFDVSNGRNVYLIMSEDAKGRVNVARVTNDELAVDRALTFLAD